jgi:serine/threonine-protein kinase
MGTLLYVAPEQLAGRPATFASDVHALGVVAYLGFTGQLPRAAGSFAELVEAGARPVPSISSLVPDLGTPFDRPVAAALANDPAARPTVDRFAARLEGGLDRWRETGASRMTGLAVAPVATTAAAAAMAPPPGPDDPTVVDPSIAVTRRLVSHPLTPASPGVFVDQRRREAAVGGAQPGWRRALGAFVIGLAVITGVVLVLAAVAPNLPENGGSARASASPARSVAATPTPSATPSPTATPSPLPSRSETPKQADPFAASADASRQMHAAIAAARGHEGLNGREAKQLDRPMDQFDRALRDRDAEAARRAAAAVADAVNSIVRRHEVSQQAGARLQNAAADLLAAAAELPG